MCFGPRGQRAIGSDEEGARWRKRRRRNGIDESAVQWPKANHLQPSPTLYTN